MGPPQAAAPTRKSHSSQSNWASDFGATLRIALTTNLLSSNAVRGLVLSDINRMGLCGSVRRGRGPNSQHMQSVSFSVLRIGLMCGSVHVRSHPSKLCHCVFLLQTVKRNGLDFKLVFALSDVTLWATRQSCWQKKNPKTFCPLRPPSGCLVFVPFQTLEKLKEEAEPGCKQRANFSFFEAFIVFEASQSFKDLKQLQYCTFIGGALCIIMCVALC